MNPSNLHKIGLLRDKFIKRYLGLELMPGQKFVSDRIIKATLEPKGEIIPAEFSRQSGKTTDIVGTLGFLGVNYHRLMKKLELPYTKKFQVVIAAPIKEQANTDFNKIKDVLMLVNKDLGYEFRLFNGNTISFCDTEYYCFSASQGSHPESKTANILCIEEAQDVDDFKIAKAFMPMLANTAGPAVYIGTAGYKRCEFHNLIRRDSSLVYDYDKIIKERREAYSRLKDPLLLNYELHCTARINQIGYDSDEYKTQYRLIWILERGELITEEQLNSLVGDYEIGVNPDKGSRLVAGIDWGKVVSSTVVTIMNEHYKIIDWLESQGDNYESQIDQIMLFLMKYDLKLVYCDATGTQDQIVSWLSSKCRESRLNCKVDGVKFSAEEKDHMFKLMNQVLMSKSDENGKITQPGTLRFPKTDNLLSRRFRNQMLEVVKEEKNNIISWHADDEKPNNRDDYVASLACALYAVRDINKNFIKMVSWDAGEHLDRKMKLV